MFKDDVMFKAIYCLFMIAICSVYTLSQDINTSRLDSLFNILSEKNKAMGSVAISKNGKIIYRKTIGYSFIQDSIKKLSTDSTKYRVGSITKTFTATMIFQLIDEGNLQLSTTLDRFFPSVANANKVTIRHLLCHQSGIHNFTDDPNYVQWMTQPKTQEELIAIISKHKADFKPGKRTSYSNSNYLLLGFIIEKLTGKSYSENLNDRIISRAGLPNTYVGSKTDPDKNECFSYQHVTSWEQMPETDMSIVGGAGSIVSTPADLVNFIENLFSLKLCSKNSFQQMTTMKKNVGMGLFQVAFFNKKGFGHSGAVDGFVSELGYFPQDSLAVACCYNGVAYPTNEIAIGILNICFNKGYSIPEFRTISVNPEDLDAYTGEYTCKKTPLKIKITRKDSILLGQATGQPSFPLVATGKDKFACDRFGLKLEFNTEKNEMILFQREKFLFRKSK